MDRRSLLLTGAAALLGGCGIKGVRRIETRSTRPRPSRAQLDWQRDELAIFLHFGVNTFTDREWGDGSESPAIFNPAALDARQWARTARAAGFRAMILTAKHHDGFCLWPTETTRHSVASSPWRGGQGDVVREFVAACREEGLRAGLYLSPWDRNHPTYGDSPRYNDVYATQLTELMTRYGPLAEVWFDGANGEGPNGKRQVYDWPRVFALVKRLQPDAVIFSDAGPDVRWCGNERGEAGDPNWSTIDPAVVPFPGAQGPGIIEALQHGHPNGSLWRPAEADVSIRPGWFYHPAEDDRVRDAQNLMRLYALSVGRNSKLLLNVPPTRAGLLHERDVAALRRFRELRSAEYTDREVRPIRQDLESTARTAALEAEFTRPVSIGAVRLSEDIASGQFVSRYGVSGLGVAGWRELSRGTTIGYAKIDQFPAAQITRLRVQVSDALEAPPRITVTAFER
jgi:alpha-L-fucosidase